MPYPEQFYDDNKFGLWGIDEKRVKYRCTLILNRLDLAAHFGDSNSSLLNTQLMWDADRCLCDMWRHDDVKKRPEYHWHTAKAANAIARGEYGSVVFEHAIPRKVVFDELRAAHAAGSITKWEDVRDHLRPRRAIALVHKDEDNHLNARWRQSMPANWTKDGRVIDAAARYRVMGIELMAPLGLPKPVVARAGQKLGRREKLEVITALFDRPGDCPPLSDYRRVGSAEDREWLDPNESSDVLTDSVALVPWLSAVRLPTTRNHQTHGYATGLPIVVYFEVENEQLEVRLFRGPMADAGLRQLLAEQLQACRFNIGTGATSQTGLHQVALVQHNGDLVEALAVALGAARDRLDSITKAMRAAGVLVERP